jgi:class 3 adenylate cyclase
MPRTAASPTASTTISASSSSGTTGTQLGDGILVLFSSASGALHFSVDAHRAAAALDLSMRIGIHAGDLIRAGDVVSGGAVNIAARICAEADGDETLVSEAVRSLGRTSADVSFHDRGFHDLKGVSDPHHLYAARPVRT